VLHSSVEYQLTQSASDLTGQAELNNFISCFPYDRFLGYLLKRGGSLVDKHPELRSVANWSRHSTFNSGRDSAPGVVMGGEALLFVWSTWCGWLDLKVR